MEIHERLKALREDRDLTQEEVAKALKTTRAQIWKYENKRQDMTAQRLKEFCDYYGVSSDYILGLPEGLNWPRKEKRESTGNCTKYYFCYNQHGRENFRGSRSSLEPLLLFSITENRYRDKGGGLTAPW
nr:MAG TPA: helix-turn-helix domain protein [Inoviridae sp.]